MLKSSFWWQFSIKFENFIHVDILGTAHYLLGYGTGNIAYGATTFFQNIYTGQGLFWQKLKAVQGVVDGCIYQGKNDKLMTILLKPRFYATVVVSRSWWDPFRMLIWLHLGLSTIPGWFYKDPTQILEKFPSVSYHVWKLIHLWSRIDSTDRDKKCLRP